MKTIAKVQKTKTIAAKAQKVVKAQPKMAQTAKPTTKGR